MEIQGQSCLLCYKRDGPFISNEKSSAVDQLRVILGTNNYNDTLSHGQYCLSCYEDIENLYKFFVISVQTAHSYEAELGIKCFSCGSQETMNIRKPDVIRYIIENKIYSAFRAPITTVGCCNDCYSNIRKIRNIHATIKQFEDLKDLLVSFTVRDPIEGIYKTD